MTAVPSSLQTLFKSTSCFSLHAIKTQVKPRKAVSNQQTRVETRQTKIKEWPSFDLLYRRSEPWRQSETRTHQSVKVGVLPTVYYGKGFTDSVNRPLRSPSMDRGSFCTRRHRRAPGCLLLFAKSKYPLLSSRYNGKRNTKWFLQAADRR